MSRHAKHPHTPNFYTDHHVPSLPPGYLLHKTHGLSGWIQSFPCRKRAMPRQPDSGLVILTALRRVPANRIQSCQSPSCFYKRIKVALPPDYCMCGPYSTHLSALCKCSQWSVVNSVASVPDTRVPGIPRVQTQTKDRGGWEP